MQMAPAKNFVLDADRDAAVVERDVARGSSVTQSTGARPYAVANVEDISGRKHLEEELRDRGRPDSRTRRCVDRIAAARPRALTPQCRASATAIDGSAGASPSPSLRAKRSITMR